MGRWALMADTTGMADLRAEHVDALVKGFGLQAYRMKQVVAIQSSDSWTETYYTETSTELTGGTGAAVKGVPRLSAFPYGEVSWTKSSKRLLKFGMEGVVSWEDAKTNAIDTIARTLLRISRAVAKAVDDEIWDVISESQSASNINSVTIGAGNEWDSATVANRDPIQDILNAIKEIVVDNYDPINNPSYLLVSPKDYANLLANDKVSNNPSFKVADVVANGKVGQICGLNIIVSNSVTADYALVIVGQQAATWKQAAPLTAKTIEDEGIKYTIRAWEVGTCILHDPKAITLIENTQA
jgi:hypothetical protein